MKTIKAPALRAGDTIGVVSPAGIVTAEALQSGSENLKSRGFKVILGRHVLSKDGFYAGSHLARLLDFNDMIRRRNVKAIFCARGGYGAVHLLSRLDIPALKRSPKILMGASDLTILLNFVHQRTGLITFHGPMVATGFRKGIEGIEESSFRMATMEDATRQDKEWWNVPLESSDMIRRGVAEGKLVGGCLSLLIASLGTPYEFDANDAILFVEDVNEAPYKIDRMLKQLIDAGKLRKVRGMIWGEMLNCDDPKHPEWTARQVVEQYSRELKVPVIWGLSSGHTRNPFVTLPIGARCRLEATKSPALWFERCVRGRSR